MPKINIDVDIWCSCGNGLCSQTQVQYGRGDPGLIVEPCEKCLADARDAGFREGYDSALEESDGR